MPTSVDENNTCTVVQGNGGEGAMPTRLDEINHLYSTSIHQPCGSQVRARHRFVMASM